MKLTISVLAQSCAVCRLAPEAPLPEWARRSAFYAITRTDEELSVVCGDANVPPDVRAETGWRVLKVAGPLDFGLTGVAASLSVPLAQAGVSVFMVSTFDTDYVLVRSGDLSRALQALRHAGHDIDKSLPEGVS